MPRLEGFELNLDVDGVLRGQGADPAIIRLRRPALVKLAEQALEESLPLVEQQVYCRELTVGSIRHEGLIFETGEKLSGKLLVQHLGQAEKVYILVCTIGFSVESYAQELWGSSAAYSLAVDGVGSAAVEALGNAACRYLEDLAAGHNWRCSVPLSPGMIDWSVEEGQPQIFRLMEGEAVDVKLTPSLIMLPKKSLTMVVGAGEHLDLAGRTCDFCSLNQVCRYQDHYNHN